MADDSLTISPADALGDLLALGRDTSQRRRVSAYLLAMPARVRPTSSAVGALLGVSAECIRMDWGRTDVQQLARSATSAGLVALMLACARGFVIALCARADGGDLEAGAALLAWLQALGALDRVVRPDAADDCGSGVAGGALASADAAAALDAALAALNAS